MQAVNLRFKQHCHEKEEQILKEVDAQDPLGKESLCDFLEVTQTGLLVSRILSETAHENKFSRLDNCVFPPIKPRNGSPKWIARIQDPFRNRARK